MSKKIREWRNCSGTPPLYYYIQKNQHIYTRTAEVLAYIKNKKIISGTTGVPDV